MNQERYVLPVCALAVIGLADVGLAQTFQDVTNAAGLGAHFVTTGNDHGPGAACGDYNGDGWVDLYLVEAFNQGGHLYKNVADATAPGGRSFELDTLAGVHDPRASTGAVFIDIDNDGDQDLYIANFEDRNTLFRNELVPLGDAVFVDITDLTDPTPGDPPGDSQEGVGIAFDEFANPLTKTLAVCFADVDRDGLVDLFVGNHNGFAGDGVPGRPGERDVLYLQRPDGTFSDVSFSAGVPGWDSDLGGGDTGHQLYSSSNAAIFVDLNNDRWMDLYVTNKVGSRLDRDGIYINRGRDSSGEWQGFEAIASALGLGDASAAAMGIDVADIDADGDFDVYITDISNPGQPGKNDLWRNDLYENDGELNLSLGPQALASYSWGTWFGDVDNDGDPDLHVATEQFFFDHLYRNDGGNFVDISSSAGIQQNLNSRGDVWLDYDQDGWIDFLVMNTLSPPTLFRNTSGNTLNGNWLVVELEGTNALSTKDALGTRISVFGDFDGDDVAEPHEVALREFTRGGGNCASSNEGVLHFGVGAAPRLMLKILWPGGEEQILNIHVNQRVQLSEPITAPDTTAPIITFLDPTPMTIAREPGELELVAEATDDLGVTEVRFFVDENLVGRDVYATGNDEFETLVRLDGLAPGPHAVRAEASDAYGNLSSATSSFVIDATTPSILFLEPDRFDNYAFGTVSGESYPAGLVFNDGCRDLTLSFGNESPGRTYFMPHDAPELFADGSRLSVRGSISETAFDDKTGFGLVLLRDPVSPSDPRIELWLVSEGPILTAGGMLPGGPADELEPAFSVDPNDRNAEHELALTRVGSSLIMEIERSDAGLRRTIGVFDANGSGIDLDDYERAGFCVSGAGVNATDVTFSFTEIAVTHPQIGEPCLDPAGWNPQIGLVDQPLVGGGSFGITIDGANGGSIAVLFLGRYEDAILPLNLGPFGAPSCSMHVLPEYYFPIVTSGSGPGQGKGMVSLLVPSSPAFIGQDYGAQWFFFSPGANPLGAVYSSGAELRLR